MYLNMQAKVTIGSIYFLHVNSIEIIQSVTELSDTAKIVLPRYYAKLNDKYVLDYIKPGDPVKIELGYEETGGLFTEFDGFVREISADIPLEISCDQLYPLRKNNLTKSYKSATLKQVLTDVIAGTIVKHVETPDATLGKFIIDNASSYQVLQKLKEDFGLFARLNGDTLSIGWAWDWRPGFTKKHTYRMQGNVKTNDLKFKTSDSFNVRVRVKIRGKGGKQEYIESGSKDQGASVITIDYAANNSKTAKDIADSRLKRSVYDGYTGSLTGFGIPRTRAGDSMNILDNREPKRQGTYLINKVTISWSDGGFDRKNELAYKL